MALAWLCASACTPSMFQTASENVDFDHVRGSEGLDMELRHATRDRYTLLRRLTHDDPRSVLVMLRSLEYSLDARCILGGTDDAAGSLLGE